MAPEFSATDMEGKEVSLSGLRQGGAVALVFLRGFS